MPANTAREQKPRVYKLSSSNLSSIAERVKTPRYDRSRIRSGILHISVGGFHRAHQAVYLDDLLEAEGNSGWGICGVGLLAADLRMRDALMPQDLLYTVIARGRHWEQAQVIGSMTEYLYAPANQLGVIEKIANPETRIVTLTITEGGYCLNQQTGELDAQHPDIAHDLQHPGKPKSALGYLAAGLDLRRASRGGPITILSCDNIQENGETARNAVLQLAKHQDPTLARWIAAEVSFPNSMVDRITPVTTTEDRALLLERYGIEDAWPVVTEAFRQWIVEDRFAAGRPPWETAGVQMTADVRPYEKMKIRLLNAGHSAIGYLGALMGFSYIHEIITEPLFDHYLRDLMDNEVTPLLPPVTGIDLECYKAGLIERFSNPSIKDQAARICMDGSSKMPKFVLPSIEEQLKRGNSCPKLTLCAASWIRYLIGRDELGREYEINDPQAARLKEAAQKAGSDPRLLLAMRDIFGDLGDSSPFVNQLQQMLTSLYTEGPRRTLIKCLGNSW